MPQGQPGPHLESAGDPRGPGADAARGRLAPRARCPPGRRGPGRGRGLRAAAARPGHRAVVRVFALLYGLRLLARTGTMPPRLRACPRRSGSTWRGHHVRHRGPRHALRSGRVPPVAPSLGLISAGLPAFAFAAVASDIVVRRPISAETPNNVIAIAVLAALGLAIPTRSAPAAKCGRCVGGLHRGRALVDNLRGLGLVAWPRSEVEPLRPPRSSLVPGHDPVRRVFERRAAVFVALEKELDVARRSRPRSCPGRCRRPGPGRRRALSSR